MAQQEYQNNPLVGYVNHPRTEIRISFTAAELDDMKKYLIGKETQRVYLTVKTGEKKDKSGTYAICSVYDPNQGQATQQSQAYAQSQGAPAPAAANPVAEEDLPF